MAKMVLNFFDREQGEGRLIKKGVKEETLTSMRSNNLKEG
jgi:hypothetical protein